jgi:hypothetical protein
LRNDQTPSNQNPMDRRDRRHEIELAAPTKMPLDRRRTVIQTSVIEFLAQPNDHVFDLERDPLG